MLNGAFRAECWIRYVEEVATDLKGRAIIGKIDTDNNLISLCFRI